jgi:hypothetical protein
MATNKNLFFKSIRYFSGSLPLLFIGPVILNSAFKNQHHPYYYIVLGFGIFICLLAVFLAFWGLRIMMKALFND